MQLLQNSPVPEILKPIYHLIWVRIQRSAWPSMTWLDVWY